MNRSEATSILRDELDLNGLMDWHVRLTNDLSKPFLGLCSYKDKCIILNAHHIDIHPSEEVIDTIKHEVAHAICGPNHGHDEVWANKAKELGCTNTLPCSHLSFNPDIIDAIRSGADVKIEFETETHVIRKPKYTVTRLQDKCPFCNKVAVELSSYLVNMNYPIAHKKFIKLECGHTLIKDIPQGTPFHLFISNSDIESVKNCKHKFIKNQCTLCNQYKPFDFQIDGMKFGEASLNVNKGVMIADEMGLGKGGILSEHILTPYGYKTYRDIKVNDFICGNDGNIYNITAIYDRGKIPVYKVTFTDDTSVIVDGEHLWEVNTPLRKWQGLEPRIKSTKDLLNDLTTSVTNSSGKKNNKWFIPITAPVNFISKSTKIDPYMMGLILGDGGFSQNSVLYFSADDELIDYCWQNTTCTKVNSIRTNGTTLLLKGLISQFKEYNLQGKKAESKFIPEEFKFNSIEVRLNILRGLMDTDGSIWNNGVIEFTTVSEQLAKDVTFIVQSLGGIVKQSTKTPTYEYKGEKLEGQLAYRLILNIPINPFKLIRKASQYKLDKKYLPTRAIINIEYIGEEEVRCISVNSPNQLYLTEYCIVTHNTIQALGLVKYTLKGSTLYIVKSGLKFQWSKQILIWLGPEYVPQIIESSNDYIIPGLRSYIIGYDMLVPKIKKFKSGKQAKQGFDISKLEFIDNIILDECQQIKNPDSSRTQQVRKLAKDKKVIPLSGTPWKNKGSEFFSALNMIAPLKFSSYAGFKRAWVETVYEGNKAKEGGIRNIPAFKDYCADIVIRRERTEVMSELPLINRMKLYCSLDTIEQKTYNDEVSAFVKWYNEYIISGTEDQINGLDILAKLARMRHIVALAKIPQTIDFVDSFIDETDRSLIIGLHHKDVGSILLDELTAKFGSVIQVLTINAQMNGKQRFDAVEKFNTKRSIMLGSQLAMGEGVDGLQRTCGDCLNHERQWNPANEEQFEGRLLRMGAKFPFVNSTYVEAEGTVDEILDSIVERKRLAFHEVMNKGSLISWNDGDLIKEVAGSIVKKFNEMNKVNKSKLIKIG